MSQIDFVITSIVYPKGKPSKENHNLGKNPSNYKFQNCYLQHIKSK
jgi:hypothetical protein